MVAPSETTMSSYSHVLFPPVYGVPSTTQVCRSGCVYSLQEPNPPDPCPHTPWLVGDLTCPPTAMSRPTAMRRPTAMSRHHHPGPGAGAQAADGD